MISIQNTLVSEDLIEKHFVCHLARCKGECFVAGEAGAPLEAEEAQYLKTHIADLEPFLEAQGRKAIAQQGAAIYGNDGSLETPLVEGKECAYTVFSETGVAKCGIEKAYNEGVLSLQKPISCHLYPVRVTAYSEFEAVNYHQWDICNTACQFGDALQIPIYQFVKKALIRKFGESWYAQLEKEAEQQQRS